VRLRLKTSASLSVKYRRQFQRHAERYCRNLHRAAGRTKVIHLLIGNIEVNSGMDYSLYQTRWKRPRSTHTDGTV
jgi:mRNA-degrading endonuclease YafQ of YafQ-DinJ toxin-antitoxin module